MTVKDAYQKYQVPPNLQEHMLRVTGLAKLIANSWQTNNLDTDTIKSKIIFMLSRPAKIWFPEVRGEY